MVFKYYYHRKVKSDEGGFFLSNHRRVFLSHSRPTLNEIKDGVERPGGGEEVWSTFPEIGDGTGR